MAKAFNCFLHFSEISYYSKLEFFSTSQKEVIAEENAKKKSKRRKLMSALTFVLNIAILAIVLIVQLNNDALNLIAPEINWKYIGILAIIVASLIVMDSLKFFILIKRSTKKSRPFLAYKVSALGRYYDNITPMSTGGQPFQMVYMNKRGIPGAVATSIPLMRYITWQISFVFISSAVLIYNTVAFGNGASNLFATSIAWVAILINAVIFMSIILLSVSKRVGPKLIIGVLKLLSKMHIVKNYQKSFRKVMRFVVNYQKTFKILASNPLVLISEILLSSGDIILSTIIPYFICLAFVPEATLIANNITFMSVFVQSTICGLSIGFIPTPGATGGAEGMFLLIFNGVFEGKPFWPMLIWRICTYYIYLLQGFLILVYDFFIGNRKLEKLKAQGAEIYAGDSKQTFRETLVQNKKTIAVVQSQEEDKLMRQSFSGMEFGTKIQADEVIKNGDLVSSEEMHEKVYPAEQMLMQLRLKELNRRKQENKKHVIKRQSSKRYKTSKGSLKK